MRDDAETERAASQYDMWWNARTGPSRLRCGRCRIPECGSMLALLLLLLLPHLCSAVPACGVFWAVATTLKYALSFGKAKAFPKLTGDRRAFPPRTGESAVRQPSDPPWSVHSLATPTPPNASWRASCKHKIQFHSSSQPLRAALTSWLRASRSVVRRKMGPLLAGNCWSGLA